MDIIYQASPSMSYRALYTPIKIDFKKVMVWVGYSPESPLFEGYHDPWMVTSKEAISNPDLEIRTRCTALIRRVANVVY